MLEEVGDARLRTYIVWVPILPQARAGMGAPAAQRESQSGGDPRLQYYWDPEAELTHQFREIIGLPETSPAWDVFFVFGPDARWSDAPPRPDFWMHQLSARWWRDADRDAAAKRFLDGEELRRQVEKLLAPLSRMWPSRLPGPAQARLGVPTAQA